MSLPTEKGVEPPPRQDFLPELFRVLPGLYRYLIELDRWFRLLVGSYPRTRTYQVTWNPTSVSANTTSEQTVTVTGLSTEDIVTVNKPTHQAGLGIVGARVSAADTLAVTFGNFTGSGIDPADETYLVQATRR